MPARSISIAAPDRSEWVPISDGSKPCLALLMDVHAAQSTVIVCREVICLSRPGCQIVQTGVSSVTPGYVQILCTRRARCRTGQRFASSVRPWMTVSYFMLFFCILNVIEKLSANSRLSEEAERRFSIRTILHWTMSGLMPCSFLLPEQSPFFYLLFDVLFYYCVYS